jgi:hypothetical protein
VHVPLSSKVSFSDAFRVWIQGSLVSEVKRDFVDCLKFPFLWDLSIKCTVGRVCNALYFSAVLNLQLMRFVFDSQTFTKRKVNSRLLFPEKLDMRPFIASGKGKGRHNPSNSPFIFYFKELRHARLYKMCSVVGSNL